LKHGFKTAKGKLERGTLIKPRFLLASLDRIAIDAVGVALLRLFGTTPELMSGRIFEQEQIAHAARLDVGVNSSEKIELVLLDNYSHKAAGSIRKVLDEQG